MLTAAFIWYFKFSSTKIQENVNVECRYMAYACGDCYPQYKVKKVKPASLGTKLTGKVIAIEFSNEKQEIEFGKQTSRCIICYNYSLSGTLYYSRKMDCYVLKLQKFKLSLPDKECCTQ